MRVITGIARGRKLAAPPGLDTRPTSDMVKEGIFSSIQFEIEGAMVLDLFAGSGQMGIEALSRGARFCVFGDISRQAQQVVLQNLTATGLQKQARVVAMDAFDLLRTTTDQFDIAFVDPPYGQGVVSKILVALAGRMSSSGVIVCETQKGENLPEQAGDFALYRQYRYGKTMVTVYRIPRTEEE